jgi:hypothetical protein
LTDQVREAAIAILRYILSHQNARDTMEGIEKWWLPQSRPYGVADVEVALRDLARHNLIRVWEPLAAQPVYGRGTEDTGSIQDYLHRCEERLT